MSYDYTKQLHRAAPTPVPSVLSDVFADVSTDGDGAQSAGRGESAVDRRLLTDGGEENSQSEAEGSEGGDDEGGDEEMAPPEQEGEAGVEEAEEEAPEEAEAEDGEAEPEETAAEEEEGEEEAPEEAEAEEAEEAEKETVDVPQSDVESVGAQEDESTTVLFLDLYGLDLDLLGLEIELHQLVLDVFATEGDGNLLGNLLSAVAGLTDPGGLSNLLPEGGLSGMLPGGDSIKSALGLGGGQEGEGEGEEGEGEEGDGYLSSAANTVRDSVPSLPVKQLLIEIIAGVIRQLLESPKKESGEEASGEGS